MSGRNHHLCSFRWTILIFHLLLYHGWLTSGEQRREQTYCECLRHKAFSELNGLQRVLVVQKDEHLTGCLGNDQDFFRLSEILHLGSFGLTQICPTLKQSALSSVTFSFLYRTFTFLLESSYRVLLWLRGCLDQLSTFSHFCRYQQQFSPCPVASS